MLTDALVVFLLWTFLLYFIHRTVHSIPWLRNIHLDHHSFINKNQTGWHWNNLLLFNDTWTSTLDLWITEVVPTFIFSAVTGHYWIFVFYYLWAAFLQEDLEHNKNNNFYPFTAGQWHLVHHKTPNKNFGLFIPLWDKVFNTEQRIVNVLEE